MLSISRLISALSQAQYVALVAALSCACIIFALRPVSLERESAATRNNERAIAGDLEFADLTGAIEVLRESGFIKAIAPGGSNILASAAIGTEGFNTSGSLDAANLPNVAAIVKSDGQLSAYLRQNGDLEIAAIGEQTGKWTIDDISIGEIALSNSGETEIIDIFGVKAGADAEDKAND